MDYQPSKEEEEPITSLADIGFWKENDMGVYIPNMSKPKDSCWNCKAQYNSVCSLKREHIRFDGILDDCPIIEVGDIQYKAFLEFNEKLIKKLEEHFLYGERRTDDNTIKTNK